MHIVDANQFKASEVCAEGAKDVRIQWLIDDEALEMLCLVPNGPATVH